MAKKTFAVAVTGLTLAFGLAVSATADAAATFQSCLNTAEDAGADYNISGKVAPSTDCTILTPLSAQGGGTESVNDPLTVNTAAFFGFTNWIFDGKYDDIGKTTVSDQSTYFDFTGNNQISGTFQRSSTAAPNNLLNFMFVFKDGNNTNLVGYLINILALQEEPYSGKGTYSNMFTDPPFTGVTGQDRISHISVYYRTGTTTSNGGTPGSGGVPEPGTLSLLGLAMLGGVFYSRRRRIVAH